MGDTAGGREKVMLASPKSVRPELVEACPERLPQADSRRGLSCFSTLQNKRQGFDKLSPNGVFYG
jgi:hypothetical protein